MRRGSLHEYAAGTVQSRTETRGSDLVTTVNAVANDTVVDSNVQAGHNGVPVPLLKNYGWCIVAGTTWYFQFFFYTMGESQMAQFGFASWTLHMSSIIIFSTIWGLSLNEWTGASDKAMQLLRIGLATLIGSTLVIGLGAWLNTR